MVLHLAYTLVRFLADLLLVRLHSDARLRAEVLALRHQLRVLERQTHRPRWQPEDRVLLAALSRLLTRSGRSSLLPNPETLLRWHRELVRRKWAAYSRRPARSQHCHPELRALVLRLARENPRWGYRRIQGELLKLGFRISHMGVAKILRSRRVPPAPRRGQLSWSDFVREHANVILATDFFTVETVWLTRLYVLFFIEIGSRRVHLGGISDRPTGEWVVQQARHLAWKLQDGELRASFLLRDRDSKFTRAFDQVFLSEGVEVIRLPFRSPRANAYAERWVGTVRRELLDYLLIFGRRHLETVLEEFLLHYHRARPHQGLDHRVPTGSHPSESRPAGHEIARHDRLGGLLHEYSWAA